MREEPDRGQKLPSGCAIRGGFHCTEEPRTFASELPNGGVPKLPQAAALMPSAGKLSNQFGRCGRDLRSPSNLWLASR